MKREYKPIELSDDQKEIFESIGISVNDYNRRTTVWHRAKKRLADCGFRLCVGKKLKCLMACMFLAGCGGDSSQTTIVDSGNTASGDTKCEKQVSKDTTGKMFISTVCSGEVVSVEEVNTASGF